MTNVEVTPLITHPDLSQVSVTLTSPDGTTVPVATTGTSIFATEFDTETAAGTWTLTVDDNVVGDTGELTQWDLSVETDAAATAVGAQTVAVPIPDATAATTTSTLNVNPTFVIQGLNLNIAVTHTDVSQLTATLTSPAGTTITVPLNTPLGTTAFDGELAGGDWTLEVTDTPSRRRAPSISGRWTSGRC